MSTSHTEAVAPQTPLVNPGDLLRCAREERGLQLSEVARQLNLTSQVVSQLEAGDFSRLPGHTFARGYIRAYAKFLEIDQAPLVEAFDLYTGTNATEGSNVQTLKPLREPIRISRILLRGFSGLLLVLLLLAGYSWWQDRPSRLAELNPFGLKHIEVDSADGVTQRHPVDDPEEPRPGSTAQQPLPLDTTNAMAPNTVPASTQATTAAIEPPEPTPEEQKPLLPDLLPGHGFIQIDYTAAASTKVTDADGKLLFNGVRKKGETLEISGKAPLELRLGYARGAAVRYNGVPVELEIPSTNKVRIKLGQGQ